MKTGVTGHRIIYDPEIFEQSWHKPHWGPPRPPVLWWVVAPSRAFLLRSTPSIPSPLFFHFSPL